MNPLMDDSLIGTVSLVSSREQIAGLLDMDQYIDLVIPRGSNELVQNIQVSNLAPCIQLYSQIIHKYTRSGYTELNTEMQRDLMNDTQN